jgi:hypothetical protein
MQTMLPLETTVVNAPIPAPVQASPGAAVASHVEFFRLPASGARDPFFGLSRSWYYTAAALGEIRMIAVRKRGAVRGVRLVEYDSVAAYIRRAAGGQQT